MGLGKTICTLTALDALDLIHDDAWPALAIGPLRVARKVWREETRKWEHTKHIDVCQIIGAAAEREQAVATLFGCATSRLYTINYENIPRSRNACRTRPLYSHATRTLTPSSSGSQPRAGHPAR